MKLPKLSMKQLHRLVKVNEAKSIKRAAWRCFISESNMYSSISSAEEIMGFKIFKHVPSGCETTQRGELVIMLARNLLEVASQIEKI